MRETRSLPSRALLLLVIAFLGPLLACKAKVLDRSRKSVLSGLTPAEAASAQQRFRARSTDLPRCGSQTPFLCDVLGKGQNDKSDRYADCLALPAVRAFGCTRIQPVTFECLPSAPAAAECRVTDPRGPVDGAMPSLQLPGEGPPPEREGFAPSGAMAPSMSIYLVRDSGTGALRSIRKATELGALYLPLSSPGKALGLASLVKNRPEWRAAERDGAGWRVWLLGRKFHAGCGTDQIVQSEVRVGADGKVTDVQEIGVPVGPARCAD
jgi:hypothetical protein